MPSTTLQRHCRVAALASDLASAYRTTNVRISRRTAQGARPSRSMERARPRCARRYAGGCRRHASHQRCRPGGAECTRNPVLRGARPARSARRHRHRRHVQLAAPPPAAVHQDPAEGGPYARLHSGGVARGNRRCAGASCGTVSRACADGERHCCARTRGRPAGRVAARACCRRHRAACSRRLGCGPGGDASGHARGRARRPGTALRS